MSVNIMIQATIVCKQILNSLYTLTPPKPQTKKAVLQSAPSLNFTYHPPQAAQGRATKAPNQATNNKTSILPPTPPPALHQCASDPTTFFHKSAACSQTQFHPRSNSLRMCTLSLVPGRLSPIAPCQKCQLGLSQVIQV